MSDAQRGGRRLHELEDVRRSSGGADAKSIPLSARWFLHICGRDRIWLWRAAGSIACKPAVMAETDERVAFGTEYRALADLPGIDTASIWEPAPAELCMWERH